MTSNLKVTDGDFVLMLVPEDTSDKAQEALNEHFQKWLKNKALHNVTALSLRSGNQISFISVSVNDPLENEILKK